MIVKEDMKYLLFLLGLIGGGFSNPLLKETHQIIKRSNNDTIFDINNVTTTTSTQWSNKINITDISRTNDPSSKIYLTLNVTQNFTGPLLDGLELITNGIEFADVFTHDIETVTQTTHITTNQSSHVVNATLFTNATIHRNIDFSNLAKRSRIDYNVTFGTLITITFPKTNLTKGERFGSIPELSDFKAPSINNFNGFNNTILLANGTGTDFTSCFNSNCTSTTKRSRTITTTKLSDDIEAISSEEVMSYVGAGFVDINSTTTVYFRYSEINTFYQIVIGEHRC